MRLLLLVLMAGPVVAADVASTRVTTYDFQIQDAAGNRISDHTRFDTALVACLNNPVCVFVAGGKYRITRATTPAPGPAPTPTPVPTPPPAPTPQPIPSTPPAPVVLTWTAPTQNTDGTAVKLPLCYRVEWGLGNAFDKNATTCATTYTVTGLGVGTWRFRVVTTNADGQSAPSAHGEKFFQ